VNSTLSNLLKKHSEDKLRLGLTTDVDIADTAIQVGGAREAQSYVLKI
jgi:hypothetical protein